MPLVRIDLLRGRCEADLAAICACVRRAMATELGVPERDQFQIVTEHDPGRLVFNRPMSNTARPVRRTGVTGLRPGAGPGVPRAWRR